MTIIVPKVLITTSGIGSRLGEMTKYTNKSLLRVGTKAALSHIIDYYPNETEFVITLGHFGSHVEEYLQAAHPDLKVEFVVVDPYEGEGSSLLYSISCAKEYLQCPFIYHASDSLFLNGEKQLNFEWNYNWIGGCEGEDTNSYRSILYSGSPDSVILQEKGSDDFTHLFPGVVGIWDYESFWDEAKKFSDGSDATILSAMMVIGSRFRVIELKDWLDVGNISAFKNAQKHFPGFENLDKVDQAVYFLNGRVIKFFSEKEACHKRVIRANNLKGIVPEILFDGQHFFAYEKFQGNPFSKSLNTSTFKSFLNYCQDNLWTPVDEDISSLCVNFYQVKTSKRIELFFKQQDLEDQLEIINGEQCPTIKSLLDKIDWTWLCKGTATHYWHGDLHSENILTNEEHFKLIDWRDDFGGSLTVGDVYYDLAKILHGFIVSHSLIKANQFSITIQNNKVEFELLRKHTLFECKKVFYQFLEEKGYDVKKVELLTALIFLNIAPLHHHSYNLLLFYLGKSMLNTYLKGAL